MWIEELANGKYKFKERYTDPFTGKYRTVSLTSTKNTASVRKEMVNLLNQKIEKKLHCPTVESNITFKELSDKFLSSYKCSVKPSTLSRSKSRLSGINKYLGDVLITNLKASYFNDLLLTQLTEQKLCYYTVQCNLSLIKMILKFGINQGYIDDITLQHRIFLPKINLPEKNNFKFLERNEVDHIIKHLENCNKNEQARMVKIQVNTGLRFSEMIAINYKTDINFEDHTIKIERIYDFTNKIYTLPKTGKTRIIYFNNDLVPVLKAQIEYDSLKMLKYRLDRNNTLLFRSIDDKPKRIQFLNYALSKIDIPNKKLTSHIFRHTYISLAIEAKIDKDIIAQQVGHTDTKMIDKVYRHMTAGIKKEQANVLTNFKII